MKKRLLLLLACAAMLLNLAACGTTGTDSDKDSGGTSQSKYTYELGKMDYVSRPYTYDGQSVDRHHYYYIPADFDPAKPMSMLFVLHGSSSNAFYMRSIDDWQTLADQNGVVIVIPEGIAIDKDGNLSAEGKTLADIGRGADEIGYIRFHASLVDPHQAYGVDDVQYINDLIDEMVNAGYVDADRVYLSGFSHGGFMCLRMALESPEKIAGVVADASLVLDECKDLLPTDKMKIVMINGDADPVVGFDGMHYDFDNDGTAEYTWAISADDSIRRFLDLYGIDPADMTTEDLEDISSYDGTTVTRNAYGEDTANPVVQYVIHGGGHTWPGGYTMAGQASVYGNTTKDITGSEIIFRELIEPNITR